LYLVHKQFNQQGLCRNAALSSNYKLTHPPLICINDKTKKEMDSRLAPYPLALLQLMHEEEGSTENPPLGIAKRIGVEKSAYNLPAHKLLAALISYTPSPGTMAREFLVELGKCEMPAVEALGLIGFVLRPETDLAEHVFKWKQCMTVLTPILQITGRHWFIKNSRSQAPKLLTSRSSRATTCLIW
jgi:hypothetical protein